MYLILHPYRNVMSPRASGSFFFICQIGLMGAIPDPFAMRRMGWSLLAVISLRVGMLLEDKPNKKTYAYQIVIFLTND